MSRFPAIVCAAGASSRCPEGKLFKLWRDKPLLLWLLETLASHPKLDRILLICGERMDEVKGLSQAFSGVETHFNADWAEGISSSLRLGERLLPPGNGFLVALGDTPLFRSETLDRVLPDDGQTSVNIPTYLGLSGHPVYIPEWAREDWRTLQGDQGAKQLFSRWGDRVRTIPVQDRGVVRDFDRLEDFQEQSALEEAVG